MRGLYRIEKFIHEVKTKMAVLQQNPLALRHGDRQQTPGVHILSLAHGDGTALWVNIEQR